ncbi:MAG: hypothetical protein JNG84_15440 [Archangium sp.]|nr:hypothetical protein [Archangium sp.]
MNLTKADGLNILMMGDFVSSLDPRMYHPYLLGALVGMTLKEEGVGNDNAEEAAELLKKGVANIPEDSRLYVWLASVQLFDLGQKEAAGQTLMAGSKAPDAPAYLGPLATRILSEVGNFELAKQFAAEVVANTDNEETKAQFEQRLKEIKVEEALTKVERALDEFRMSTGRPATSLQDVVSAGLLAPEDVTDPMGQPIELTPRGPRSKSIGSRLRIHRPGENDLSSN